MRPPVDHAARPVGRKNEHAARPVERKSVHDARPVGQKSEHAARPVGQEGVHAARPVGVGLCCAALLALLALTGCAGDPGAAGVGDAEPQALTVLAAASLTDVLEQVAADVEADHEGLEVRLSFAGSSTVVQQVNEGAPADVVALAGEKSLGPLEQERRTSEPVVFATNTLQVAVPPDNPAGIAGLDDLTGPGLQLVVCDEAVPCGSAAATLFADNGLEPRIASYEKDVRATLTKVELGEADAGLVYRTDVAAAGDRVLGIDIPADRNVVNSYPVLTVSDSPLAQAFVDELTSERGQAHLTGAGFGIP